MLSIPIGVSFGLAMASKLNGFVSLIFFFILSVILFYKIPKIRLNLFLSFITVSAVMLSVFVILNPFVWKNPIEGTAFMVQHRWNETLYYQVQPGFKPILTFGERLYFLLARTILPGGDYVIRNHGTPLGLILFLFGGWGLYSDLKSKKNKLKIFAKLILIYGLMMWIVMGIYLKLDWDRYYLPFVPFVVIVSSRGIVKIVEFFRWFKNKYLQRVFLE
jgi:4-amino-4-deoxy-L-arabinose transferase-like glycosyltransferase